MRNWKMKRQVNTQGPFWGTDWSHPAVFSFSLYFIHTHTHWSLVFSHFFFSLLLNWPIGEWEELCTLPFNGTAFFCVCEIHAHIKRYRSMRWDGQVARECRSTRRKWMASHRVRESERVRKAREARGNSARRIREKKKKKRKVKHYNSTLLTPSEKETVKRHTHTLTLNIVPPCVRCVWGWKASRRHSIVTSGGNRHEEKRERMILNRKEREEERREWKSTSVQNVQRL